MASRNPKSEKTTYRVKSAINYDGKLFVVGDDIELPGDQAEPLLTVGAIEPIEPVAAEAA